MIGIAIGIVACTRGQTRKNEVTVRNNSNALRQAKKIKDYVFPGMRGCLCIHTLNPLKGLAFEERQPACPARRDGLAIIVRLDHFVRPDGISNGRIYEICDKPYRRLIKMRQKVDGGVEE